METVVQGREKNHCLVVRSAQHKEGEAVESNCLEQHCSSELSGMMEMFHFRSVQHGSH